MFWLLWPQAPRQGESRARQTPARNPSRPSLEKPAASPLDAFEWIDPFGDQFSCVLNRQGDCLSSSPHMEALTGLQEEDCLGRHFLQRIHPDFRPRLRERLTALAGHDAPKLRCQFRHADGEWHWYDLAFLPLEGERQQALSLCVLRNISAEIQAQKTLQKAKLEAELALKGRSEFLANMSHELRTPLNAIIGFSQIMESQIFGKITNRRYLEYLGNIQESGAHLLSRINDLLEISALDAGAVTLKEEQVRVSEVLRSAVEMHSHRAFASQVQILEDAAARSVVLYADRVKLTQAVSNLLSNALKFSRPRQVVVLRAELNGHRELTISVIDSGRGMGLKQLDRLRRLLAEDNSLYALGRESIGLGIVIAKEFAALHQGRLAIHSQPNKGTTATLTLPKERTIAVASAGKKKKTTA